MATNFPGGIDTFSNPNATSSLDSPSHSGLHTDMGDAMTAVQTQLVNQPYGLIHINTTTFSAVASQSINNVFSATYKSYKIIFNFSGSVNALIDLRLRVGGTDASGASDYRYANYGWNTSSSASPTASAGASFFRLVPVGSTVRNSMELTVFNPFQTVHTTLSGTGFGVDTSLSVETGFRVGGRHGQNVSYDGFNVIVSTGNITGQISIYGLKD